MKYQKEGLTPPQCVIEATEKFRKESNPLEQFVEDCCVVGGDKSVYNMTLRNFYADWCKAMSCPPIAQGKFTEALEAKGFVERRRPNIIPESLLLSTTERLPFHQSRAIRP